MESTIKTEIFGITEVMQNLDLSTMDISLNAVVKLMDHMITIYKIDPSKFDKYGLSKELDAAISQKPDNLGAIECLMTFAFLTDGNMIANLVEQVTLYLKGYVKEHTDNKMCELTVFAHVLNDENDFEGFVVGKANGVYVAEYTDELAEIAGKRLLSGLDVPTMRNTTSIDNDSPTNGESVDVLKVGDMFVVISENNHTITLTASELLEFLNIGIKADPATIVSALANKQMSKLQIGTQFEANFVN